MNTKRITNMLFMVKPALMTQCRCLEEEKLRLFTIKDLMLLVILFDYNLI